MDERDFLSVLGYEDDEEEIIEETNDQAESQFDTDVLKSMLLAGENSENLFEPNPEAVHDEEQFDEGEVDISGARVTEQLGEYAGKILFDMKENPDAYMVETSEGMMKLDDALAKGWNPATKEFDEVEPLEMMMGDEMGGLSPEDQMALQGMMDPSAAHVPPEQAGMYGLDPNDPMVHHDQPQQEMMPPEGMDPNMMGGLM